MTNFLVISAAPTERIEHHVCLSLQAELVNRNIAVSLARTCHLRRNPVRGILSLLPLIISSSCIVVHSPLTLSLFHLILFKILRKKIVAIVWDVYPWHLNSLSPFKKSIKIRIIDFIEPFLFNICTSLVVPTSDFLNSRYLVNAKVIPFWPRYASSLHCQSPVISSHSRSVIEIVFCGQIGPTRDLVAAYNKIRSIAEFKFRLHVFSNDVLPDALQGYSNVAYSSYISSENLSFLMSSYHLGLISLSPSFDAPAFPSKVFDYLVAGLPCLYHGPPMPDYVSLLKDHNVGLDITTTERLSLVDLDILVTNFSSNAQEYLDSVCLSPHSVASFLHILNHSE